MLYYLVTYVRENLDKGPPPAVLGDAPNLAIIPDSAHPELARSELARSDSAGPNKSQRTDGAAKGDQRLAEPHRLSAQPIRGGSTALTLLMVAGMVVELCGCACLRRDKVDSKVVSARQMSLQGIEALQCGKWDDAEQCFAGALRQNPADERAHRHFAEVLWHRGDLRNAIQHQEESVRLSGGDTTLLVQLGEMYLQDNNIEAASECVEEALDGNRHVSGAWALRGDIHRRRGESNQAFECYHRALNYTSK